MTETDALIDASFDVVAEVILPDASTRSSESIYLELMALSGMEFTVASPFFTGGRMTDVEVSDSDLLASAINDARMRYSHIYLDDLMIVEDRQLPGMVSWDNCVIRINPNKLASPQDRAAVIRHEVLHFATRRAALLAA